MLSLLDDHVPRPKIHDPSCGLNEVHLFRQLSRFAVVERNEIDLAQELEQIGAATLNPEVHRIACDESRPLHLLQHIELKSRIDVREKDKRRIAKLVGNLGTESRKYTEVRLECLGG